MHMLHEVSIPTCIKQFLLPPRTSELLTPTVDSSLQGRLHGMLVDSSPQGQLQGTLVDLPPQGQLQGMLVDSSPRFTRNVSGFIPPKKR